MLANHTSTSNHILKNGGDINDVDDDDNDDARVGVSIVNPSNENAKQKNRQHSDIQFNDIRKSGILLNIPTKSNNAKRTYTTPMSRDMNHEKFTPCCTTRNSKLQHRQHEKSISSHSTSGIISVKIINANSLQQKNVERKSIRNNYSHAVTDETGDGSVNNETIAKIKPPPRNKRKKKLVISTISSQVEVHGNKNAEANKLLPASSGTFEMATSKITTATAPTTVPFHNDQMYISLNESITITTPCQPTDVPGTSKFIYNKLDPWTVKSTDNNTTLTHENSTSSSCPNNYCSRQQKLEQNEIVLHSFEDHFVADNWPSGNECSNESTIKNVNENDAQSKPINMFKKGNSQDIFKSFDSENMQQQILRHGKIDENLQFNGVHHQLANTIFSQNCNKKINSISSEHIHNNMHMVESYECKSDSQMFPTNGNAVKNDENVLKQEDMVQLEQQHSSFQSHYHCRQQNLQNNFTGLDKKPYTNNDECKGKNENQMFRLNHDRKPTLLPVVAEIKVEVATTTAAAAAAIALPTTTPAATPSNCNGIVFMDDRKSCFDDSLIKPKVNNDDSFVAKHAMDIFRTNNFGCRNDDGYINGRKNLYAKCESGSSSGFSDNTNRTSGIMAKSLFENGKMVSENEHFNGKLGNILLNILYY